MSPIFNNIVSIASGLTIIIGLISVLVKPIRERITKSKEQRQYLSDKFEAISNSFSDLNGKVTCLDEKIGRNQAEQWRTQILRFADELYERQAHTKEHFVEILSIITKYNQYCDDHKDFKNERTMAAQKTIKTVYEHNEKNHCFLGDDKIG